MARVQLSDAARRFGPLTNLAGALALVILVLPSALNLPQSNPSTTPEFAPVPPKDQNSPTHVQGNLAGLGTTLGNGLSPGGGAPPPAPTPPSLPPGDLGTQGKTPTTKLCVGNPPRQTEDQLSPPCVAYFNGKNGGATAQGVTANEVRLLYAYNPDGTAPSPQYGPRPRNKVINLCQPAASNEFYVLHVLRALQKYFNYRYQTYNRQVCIYVYFAPSVPTAETARAYAEDVYAKVHPFAVNASALNSETEFNNQLASHGVVAFGAGGEPASFYTDYPGFVYGYSAGLELTADLYTSYVCRKLKPYATSFAGPAFNGKPRKYGFVSTTDSTLGRNEQIQARLIRKQLEACGIHIDDTATFPTSDVYRNNPYGQTSTYADQAMADFSSKGITTILWGGGWESNFSHSAKTFNYFPEWVVTDNIEDGIYNGEDQDQDVWSHAMVVTPNTLVQADGHSHECDEAYDEFAPGGTKDERDVACLNYPRLRQIFIGIQIAGPKLTAKTMDQGFHAIPAHPSSTPTIPACFYLPHDYTCVKDATVVRWDPKPPNALGGVGCYRMSENGKRYLAGQWPTGNPDTQWRPNDICQNLPGAGNGFPPPP